MKTISSRFLKGTLAMLLAVIMVFGTTLTGFAAVVDNAETSVDHSGGYGYFLKPSTWTESKVMMFIGKDSYTSVYEMSKVANTNNLYRYDIPSWGGATYVAFANAGSVWGSGNWGPSNRTNAAHYTNVYNNYGYNSGSYYVHVPASTSNGAALAINYKSSASNLNLTTTANVYGAAAGSTSYSSNAAAGTVSVSGYYMSAYNTASTRSAVSSTSSSASASTTLAPGSTATFKATPAAGYEFVGWSTSNSESNIVSTSTTYNYAYDISYNGKTMYALFKQAGYTYTVTAGEGGSVSPTSGTASSVEITATPNTGYAFDKWTCTNGSVANVSSATTTFTPSANGANANATFTKNKYTVTASASPSAGGTATVTTSPVEYGSSTNITATANDGYRFTGWTIKSGTGTFGSASSASTTYSPTSNSVLTANFSKIDYSITVKENDGTGTVNVASSAQYGDSVSLSVTAPTNYKILSITGVGLSDFSEGESYSGSFTMPANNVEITITYALNGVCKPVFAYGDQSLVLGGTFTNTATTNEFCEGNKTFTYSSSAPLVADVDSNGTVTALKPGTATITATCDCGAKATYKVTVKTPSVSVANMSLDVNGTATASPTIADGPASGYAITYSTTDTDIITVGAGDGVVTAIKPGIATVSFAMTYGGNTVATGSFGVTVNAPTVSITPNSVNLLVGQTMTDAFATTTSVTAQSVTLATNAAGVATVSGGKATAVGAGTATITASFKYNDSYTATATATVNVVAPTISADKASVTLEYGGTTTQDVTITTNASSGNGTGDDITVSSANSSIATATVSGNKVTIEAKSIGSTTVTAKFHDATVEIPVTVKAYDPYVYLYVTDNLKWGTMYLHGWEGTGSYSLSDKTQMTYIGKNGQGQNIFAFRFPKDKVPAHLIFANNTSWNGSANQTVDIRDVNFNEYGYLAYYFTGSTTDNKQNVESWTSSCSIVRPTVTVADITVSVADTATATATVTNGDKVLWTIEDSSVATVADVDTQTATVTGVTPGDTTITARAFVDTANSSIETLPTNYKTDKACWDFISTEATANVNVGSMDYSINAKASYSPNGTSYNDGDIGGTVKATVGGTEYTSFPVNVAHGTSYTLTATENSGYRFVEWVNGNGETVSTENSYTVTATADASYTAKFVKTVKVSVVLTEGIASVTYNGVTHTEGFDNLTVDVGSSVEISAAAKSGYIFTDWTVTGATVADTTANPITISNIQSSLTVTANSIPVYTASATAYTNKLNNTNGGSVTIDGKTSPVSYKAGDTVNFEAHASANYYFDGWYSDANFTNFVSADANYQTTMTASGITLYGLFVKHYYIDGDIVGGTKLELNYNVAANTYSASSSNYTGNAFTVKDSSNSIVPANDVDVINGTHTGATVTGDANGYTLVPNLEDYDTSNIMYTLTPDSTFDGSYNLNITLTPATKVEISVNDTKVADKAVGSTFVYEITPPAGQYLANATIDPAVEFSIDGNTVSFTVPNENVNIVPQFANYSYVNIDTTGLSLVGYKTGYKAGEEITIKISPATAQVSIQGVTSDNIAAVVTNNGDGTFTVNIASMPADTTIKLTPTIDAKFAMNSGVAVIGNYGTGFTKYGSVSMSIGGNPLAEGGFADKTDTVTYTATPNDGFIFDGLYSDAECTPANLLTRNSTYDVTPTKDTTVYALFVPKHYLACDLTNYSDKLEMTYIPADRAFTLVSSTIDESAEFRVTNNANEPKYWADNDSYSIFDGNFNVTHNQKSSNGLVTVSWGQQRWKLTSNSEAEYPYTFILTLDGNKGVDMSVDAAKSGYSVFLSSGRVDIPGSYDSAVFDAESVFTTTGLATPTDGTASHDGETREKYKKLKIAEAQTLSFQTTLTGTSAANYRIDSYVVYFIEDETYEIVTPFSMGENVYTGSVYAKGDCYIIPIYFLTDEYAANNNLSQIEIYFDASAIKDQAWGPFVACYAWGTNDTEYFGGWSGQMMIPSADGKSFFTQLTVPKSGAEGATSIPNGVTFNNYMQATCVSNNAGAFGVSSTQYQCYDYREPITLYEAGYDVITFVAKDSTDGYHGDRGNGVTLNTVSSDTKDIFDKFDFDYLYCRDGVTPMDLNGNAIEKPVDLSTGAKADYYVITKGDITYGANGKTYVGDSAYDAKWSVDWYVFDSNGTFITSIMSTALWHDTDNNLEELETYLHQALGVTAADVAGKTVAISYEHENNANHQVSYDGQWYGNYRGDNVTAQVVVGLQNADGTFTVNESDPYNDATYGEGYLKDTEGGLHQTLDIKIDYGRADLTAAAKSGFRFLGWYTKQADGRFVQILKAPTASTYINMNETYFAMFKAIGSSEVVINHRVYENDDPVIPAHNGVGQLSVVVYDSTTGEVVASSTPNTTSSTAVFEAQELHTYTIEILTTPLMNGEFFAWYTDSQNADGTKTYEEVFTDESVVGKTTPVEATFEYTYDSTNPDNQNLINIYSDIRRVSNLATLRYKYTNRFGKPVFYTVKDIVLKDNECTGYQGNDFIEYCPTFRTELTFSTPGNEELKVYVAAENESAKIEEYVKDGYTLLRSYNQITYLAPKEDVTEVYNGTVKWVVSDVTLTPAKSEVTLVATGGEPTYTVYYEMAGESGSQTGYYNDLLNIVAPDQDQNGKKFSYWYDETNDIILTYTRHYNYRIVENKTIKAVYGATDLQDWSPTIQSVTYTREFGDDHDYIYTDYLLAFTSKDGKVLNDVKAAEGISYGLLVLRDSSYYISNSANVTYPDANNAEIQAKLNKIVTETKKSAAFTVDAVKYNCYYYDLTQYELTNFNRCDYFRQYDNRAVVGGTHSYKEYAFTSIAYVVDGDGNVYFSKPMNVNFFDLGSQKPTN